jgi:hypothetical protein
VASAAERLLYVDASALVKLVVAEPESDALVAEIRGSVVASSELALAEVPRAIHRLLSGRRAPEREALLRTCARVLDGVALVPLDRALLVRAGSFSESYLRTLDAIHVASALSLTPELDALVTYDERQLEVAGVAGLPVLRPT